jgi:hypothetical protein
MTHNQIVAALQRGYQLDDARESRRGCYPIRKPAPRTPFDKPDRPGSAKASGRDEL